MRVAHFVSGFPVLSETFVQDEIHVFSEEGFENTVVSLRPPIEPLHGSSEKIRALGDRSLEDLGIRSVLFPGFGVLKLFRGLGKSPWRGFCVQSSLVGAVVQAPFQAGRYLWTAGRVLEAVSDLHGQGIRHCHAHFAHFPADLAWGVSRILGTSFSWNAHSYDLHLHPTHLKPKIRDADRIFPVSKRNERKILETAPEIPELSSRVTVIRCGIDLKEYPFDGTKPLPEKDSRVRLLGVGRLVDTKGFDTLIRAAEILSRDGWRIQVEIIGEGPEREKLLNLVSRLGLSKEVQLLGALTRQEVRNRQRSTDILVQPCKPGKTGLDEIPVVLMEAMALGIPVVSTDFAGIPELVEDGVTGRLVAPGHAEELANAIIETLQEPDKTYEAVRKARSRIEREYNASENYRKKVAIIRKILEKR